jgi:predicted porin
MKKALIPAALALAFAGTAQAQLSLYGLVDMSYGKSLLGDVFLDEKADFHSGGDNGSSEGNSTTRVGIKGAIDVGSGVKANFRFETGGIDSDGEVNGGGNFFNRQAWFGLSGSMGEVRLGRQDSVSFQQMIDFDFNGASNGVSAGAYSGVGVFLPGRQSRSLQYITPAMGGLTAQVGFVPKGNRQAQQPPGVSAKDIFSIGGKFAAGPLLIGASYQSKGASDEQDFTSVAGSYDFGAAKVMLGYADGGKFNKGGSGSGPTVGLVAPIAGVNVGFHYSQNRDKDLKLTSSEVFINKEVFKNTYFYAEAGNWKTSLAANPLDPAAKRSGSGYALGVIFTF